MTMKKNSEGEEWGGGRRGGRGGGARNHAQYVSMGIWESSQRSKVSSKLWDCSQMVHSWRERISFCMYNFEKVTRRADRHERTWEPSRGRRSEEKIRQSEAVPMPWYSLNTLSAWRHGYIVCVCARASVCAYRCGCVLADAHTIFICHAWGRESAMGSQWIEWKVSLPLCSIGGLRSSSVTF